MPTHAREGLLNVGGVAGTSAAAANASTHLFRRRAWGAAAHTLPRISAMAVLLSLAYWAAVTLAVVAALLLAVRYYFDNGAAAACPPRPRGARPRPAALFHR